jgi:hypothetical protein
MVNDDLIRRCHEVRQRAQRACEEARQLRESAFQMRKASQSVRGVHKMPREGGQREPVQSDVLAAE